MTARDNYDSNAINTGLSVGEIFSQLEVQMISNRKAIFEKASIADNFKASVYLQLESFMEANKKAAAKALSEAVEISSTVIKKSYEKGISTVDKAMDNFKQQGYKPPQEPSGNAKMIGLVGIATAVIGVYKSITAYSQDKAKGQLLSIASLVNNDAEDLYSEIDRVQAIYLKKGIAGAEDKAGNEKSMSAQAEYTLRNESQQALITAEGERNAEYGHHLVIVTAHPSCCPLCLPWQQQILVDDVFSGGLPDGKHELLSTALAAGLGHYNCRHNWVTFVEGLDKHDIFKREQASPNETALRYAVEQEQRYNERMIREWKRREAGAMTEQSRRQAEYKVKEWQAQQRHLGKIADEKGVPFYRQYAREQVGGKTEHTIKPEVAEYLTRIDKNDNIKVSGATTIAGQAKEELNAAKMYSKIEKSDKDIAKIAKNTGIGKETIADIKKHLYHDKHNIYGEVKKFDPNYEQAVSWKRLESGKNIKEKDIIFIKHEVAEMEYIKQGLTRDQAHILATKKYNFSELVRKRGDEKW